MGMKNDASDIYLNKHKRNEITIGEHKVLYISFDNDYHRKFKKNAIHGNLYFYRGVVIPKSYVKTRTSLDKNKLEKWISKLNKKKSTGGGSKRRKSTRKRKAKDGNGIGIVVGSSSSRRKR